jgi:2-polyprenyl-3-methyl-5-hydroxy-6-metoxy-1,4-benzoquinol methylase
MNDSFLNELLIDPITKEQLLFDKTSNTLRSSSSGKNYNLVESIPQIIINENQSTKRSGIHQEYNSDFNYSDHYQKDAVLFDYSEHDMPVVTKFEFSRLRESIIREISDDLSIVLDVGCGNGWVAKKLIPLGKKVISMDISSINPINSIRDVQHKNHAGLIADVYNIPLKENSIDCIIAAEIMEHVPDPKTLIFALVKLLKNKGKLIITTPYNEKIEYYLCVHCNRPTPRFAHLHSFNKENIKEYIPSTGVIWSIKIFMNRYLSIIRSHSILKFFPFNFWMFIDKLFNRIYYKPTRMQLIIIKE